MCPREGEREPGAYKKAHTGRGTHTSMKTAPGREAGRRMNMARGAPQRLAGGQVYFLLRSRWVTLRSVMVSFAERTCTRWFSM